MSGLATPLKPSQLRELLLKTIPAKLPVLITGQPGGGKTAIGQQISDELGANYIPLFPVISDPTDFKGMPYAKNGRAEFLPFADTERLIKAGKLTVCSIEDLGQAPPAVQAATMQLIHARIVCGQPVSDNVVFIATTNRRQDKSGVRAIFEALKSRFATIVELVPDPKDWVKWAIAEELPLIVIALVKFRPDLINSYEPTIDLTNTPSPRTLHHAAKLIEAGIPPGLEGPVLSGAAGEVFAAEYLGFEKVWRNLPKIEEIRARPETAPVPDVHDPATMYAVSTMVASYASAKNLPWILKYASRLSKDFEIRTVTDCHIRDRDILDTRAYTEWAAQNQKYTVGM